MDQKHAMLYPPIDPGQNTMQRDTRISASAAIGLPREAPPSYDMAMAAGPGPAPSTSSAAAAAAAGGWIASAPEVTPDIVMQQPQMPTVPQSYPVRPSPLQSRVAAAAVIVEQPSSPYYQRQQPTVPQPTNVPSALPFKLGPNPCTVTCPACGTCKTTRMCYTPNSRTHLCALLLCLVGWCCCACCVPYCMNSCRTGNHYCAKCNTFLGTFNPRDSK